MPQLRIERRTFEKATLGGVPPSSDDEGLPYDDEIPPYEGENTPVGAFAISINRNPRRNPRRHVSAYPPWLEQDDRTMEESLSHSPSATSQPHPGQSFDTEAAQAANQQEHEAKSWSDKCCPRKNVLRCWIILAITILAVGVITAVVVVLSLSDGGDEGDDSSLPSQPAFEYLSCSDLHPTAKPSDIPNYDRLVEELGLDGSPMLQDCGPVEEASLFVSQDYERLTEESRLNRFVLATLFVSTKGRAWFNNTGWMTSESECNWFGIYCEDGRVTSIDIADNRLLGPIPEELGRLDSLEILAMRGNLLSGSIPSSVQYMTNLARLDLSINLLVGDPLSFLVHMTWLEELSVSSNDKLTGTMPSSIGDMTVLETLQFDFNRLHGEVPETLGEISTLKTLHLGGNDHDGTLPSSLGKLERLRDFKLQYTSMVGRLPTELGKLSALTSLIFQEQGWITGTLPSELGRCTHLESLNFFEIPMLTGTVPSSFTKLTKLTRLDLQGTQISGTLPLDLCDIVDEFQNIVGPCTLDCHYCCSQPQC